ncbi:hypothetical protein J2741_001565 [Methanolinea mesophila]|uniref:hypothetical protein n=1 Tax=Methanolinea mesophila TaxID=547055 RepID=UPI001AE80EB2|nr:hypothetical protein [Methanolinea mesophila]MBP1929018.1 hypothetical protein [Methanolinea mesophila]
MKKCVAGLVLTLMLLLAGVVSAQTYDCYGSNQNGEWAGTLYMGENGEVGLSIVGVVGGTFSADGPVNSPQNSLGSSGSPVLSQQYTIDAENGQGFASCTLDDAQGNHADTYVNVYNGVVNTEQEVGFYGKDSGVYSSQEICHSEADLIQAETASESANGDWAEVEAYASGTIRWLDQYAGTKSWGGVLETGQLGTSTSSSGSVAYANQEGMIGGRCDSADWAAVEATAMDEDGCISLVSTEVFNGTLKFDQHAKAKTIEGSLKGTLGVNGFSGSELEAEQCVDLKGTSGTVESFSADSTGVIYSQVLANFTNGPHCGGWIPTGSLEAKSWAELENDNYDTDTEAGLVIDPSCRHSTLDDFGIYAEAGNALGIDSDSRDGCCRKDYLAIAKSDDDWNFAKVFRIHHY